MDFDSFWEGFWDSKWIKSEPLFQRICGIRFSMDLLLILNVFWKVLEMKIDNQIDRNTDELFNNFSHRFSNDL